jgi:hypothetical protein
MNKVQVSAEHLDKMGVPHDLKDHQKAFKKGEMDILQGWGSASVVIEGQKSDNCDIYCAFC